MAVRAATAQGAFVGPASGPPPLTAPAAAASVRGGSPARARSPEPRAARAGGGRLALAAAPFLAAGAARRSAAKGRRRGPRVARQAGIIGRIKSLFKKQPKVTEVQQAAPPVPPPAPAGAPGSVVVSSSQTLGQPFCGEYADQGQLMNGRRVFKKLGTPEGAQDIYLLFNNAQQWAFTPHSDGRPDGWAFCADAAAEPSAATAQFSIWDGTSWMPDGTLSIAGVAAPAPAAPPPPPAEAAPAAADAPARAEEVAPEAAAEPAAAEPAAAVAPIEPVRLPDSAAPLGVLHWKSHWSEMEKCEVKWPPIINPETLSQELPQHPRVKRGVLPNGLRYIMLQNAMPPQRFEAHIELHVGSIDEEPHEQGIAHMMEHVCFLGSRKRERLVGTGSRSNALTDFQHTIYHIHAPNKLENGRDMFIPALEALNEIAFAPEMLQTRIEKERKAVLAEMQQVNDMEYRIETWTLSGLHETNKLGTQFPIGKEEQIKGWQQKDLRAFHDKWYYPGNATLYVVGDMTEEEMEKGIRRVFESAPARHKPSPDTALLDPVWGEDSADARSLFRRKIARFRPEQLHNFSLPMIGTSGNFTAAASFDTSKGEEPWHGPLQIFRNELLEGLQLNFYAKAPVRPLRKMEDILYLTCVRILIGVIQFRIVSRYSSNHAPVQIDHSDSFREGCAVTSITVNADPRDWRNALACVVQEVRAVCDYGITESEQKRYMDAMLKDVEKGVVENDTVPSEDHLNFIMTSDVFDHIIMHPDQSYEVFKQVAPMVTSDLINTVAKWMFGFLGYYGKSTTAPPTAIVVCTPTQVFEEQSGQWTPFQITEEEIVDLLLTVPSKSKEEALNQVEVPESLLQEQLEALLAGSPVDADTAWRATSRKVDEQTGITQLMLPNGARVNYACTTNESQGTMRMLVPGGRSSDAEDELGAAMVGIRTISESGAVSTFSREQIELFAVSNLMSVHLDLNIETSYVDATFAMTDNGLVAVLELLHLLFTEPRWELPAFVRAQQAYKAQSYAVQKSLEKSTLDRLMNMMYRDDPRVAEPRVSDLNKLTLAKVRKAVSAQLRPQDLEINLVADFEGLTQHKVQAVEGAMSTGKHHATEEQDDKVVETSAVAALREKKLEDLDKALWKYLGSIPKTDAEQAVVDRAPVISRGEDLPVEEREKTSHLEDSDERAVANLGGGAPNRWGKGDAVHAEIMAKKNFSWDTPDSPIKDHVLYPSMCLLAMREAVNTRLFSRVRDSLGLSYDCSFELSMLDRLEAGWYTCTVSSHPSRIGEAVDAAKGVLQGVLSRPISELELSTARRTLLRRHETDLQSNEHWISLLTNLQSDAKKDISCVRDIESVLSKLTAKDLQNAFLSLLTDSDQIFVSVTTAGPGSYGAGAAAARAAAGGGAQKELVSLD